MTPAKDEAPQIAWPVVEVAGQSLIVKWTFYAQWLLSKRGVDVKELGRILHVCILNAIAKAQGKPEVQKLPVTSVDTLVEAFAAAVAENFTPRSTAPTAEYWAQTISDMPNPLAKWSELHSALWEAIKKVKAAEAPPAPQVQATGKALTN